MKDALTALVVGMACILFGIIFFLANYSEERLSCSSTKRSCELTKTYLISPDAITFIDLNKITKIEYRKIRENKGSTGFSVLWGEKGEERKILRGNPYSSLEDFNISCLNHSKLSGTFPILLLTFLYFSYWSTK